MSVEVIWDDEAKTIIRQVYAGTTILDDYYKAVDEFVELATSVDYMVHSIMDRTQITSAPGTILQVMRYADKLMPDNVGLRIIVKPTMLTKIFADMGKRIAPKLARHVHYCDTLDEAHALIEQYTPVNQVDESGE